MTKIKCKKCDSWSLPYDIGKKIRADETLIHTITKVLETKLIKIKKEGQNQREEIKTIHLIQLPMKVLLLN